MYEYKAKILRVIDGDTFEASIDLGFHTHRVEKLRIYGYDAPEVKLYEGVTEDEKQLGLEAKKFCEELFSDPENQEITIRTHYDKTGKYGRFLATMMVNYNSAERDFKQLMEERGFVKDRG